MYQAPHRLGVNHSQLSGALRDGRLRFFGHVVRSDEITAHSAPPEPVAGRERLAAPSLRTPTPALGLRLFDLASMKMLDTPLLFTGCPLVMESHGI